MTYFLLVIGESISNIYTCTYISDISDDLYIEFIYQSFIYYNEKTYLYFSRHGSV